MPNCTAHHRSRQAWAGHVARFLVSRVLPLWSGHETVEPRSASRPSANFGVWWTVTRESVKRVACWGAFREAFSK